MNRKTLLGDPPPVRIAHQDLRHIEGLPGSSGHLLSPAAPFLRDGPGRAAPDGRTGAPPLLHAHPT